jgi:hypothetical protein
VITAEGDEPSRDELLASCAINLQRIADALEALIGAQVAQLHAKLPKDTGPADPDSSWG